MEVSMWIPEWNVLEGLRESGRWVSVFYIHESKAVEESSSFMTAVPAGDSFIRDTITDQATRVHKKRNKLQKTVRQNIKEFFLLICVK